jgi:hypothetical protein
MNQTPLWDNITICHLPRHLRLPRSLFNHFSLSVAKMKSTILSLIAALATQQVTGHSIFQDLWVNGVDEISVPSRDVRFTT